jgi:pimeloyl-ACP methyl ester carboxylesterase
MTKGVDSSHSNVDKATATLTADLSGKEDDDRAECKPTLLESPQKKGCRKNFRLLLVPVALLIVALAVWLAQRPKNNVAATRSTSVNVNNDGGSNLHIYDEALILLKASPQKYEELSSGEVMSYREYNRDRPHKLVVLPGFMTDDSIYSILATLPQFEDHHVIVVNPIGWNGSTMNNPKNSHEENADQVYELLEAIGMDSTMVMGVSTGGGIAAHMAIKHPEIITAAFLVHSIPLHANKFMMTGTVIESLDQVQAEYPSDPDMIYELFRSLSSNPDNFIPRDHELTQYLIDGAIGMPGKSEVGVANVKFNLTPIKTPFAEPSFELATLKSKIAVIHGSKDFVNPAQLVESVTKLAIADQWAPPGMLSFHDDEEGHLVLVDKPNAFADVYRKAFEEQVLA